MKKRLIVGGDLAGGLGDDLLGLSPLAPRPLDEDVLEPQGRSWGVSVIEVVSRSSQYEESRHRLTDLRTVSRAAELGRPF